MSERELELELEAPCVFCGYNGTDYWQAGTHNADCPIGEIGGRSDREAGLRFITEGAPIVARLAARVAELEGENAKLRACVKAADAYRAKSEEIDASPSMRGIYGIAYAHGVQYVGETMESVRDAYDAARAALDAKGDAAPTEER